MKLLIAQEKRSECEYYRNKLEEQGIDVVACTNGDDACVRLLTGGIDAAVLDTRLEGKGGGEILLELRSQRCLMPVIFLTDEDELDRKVEILNAGASDYIVKPVSMQELVARIRAVTRTADGTLAGSCQVEDLTIDYRSHEVTRAGRNIDLTRREYALLEYLALNKGRVVTKETILNRLWGYEYMGASNVVEVYMNYLRRKVDGAYDVKLLRTVRGRGYILQAERQENDKE